MLNADLYFFSGIFLRTCSLPMSLLFVDVYILNTCNVCSFTVALSVHAFCFCKLLIEKCNMSSIHRSLHMPVEVTYVLP